uniref:Uncharacterized protein n=2 Tax=Timema TaxID=61471 RepID=A0A7R9IDF7_9NEOP|nr:unnamed protein product [Timema tahoe]
MKVLPLKQNSKTAFIWRATDIPILPTVTAKITFQEFAFRNDVKPELFEIPKNYVEDPTRFVKDWFMFPDL